MVCIICSYLSALNFGGNARSAAGTVCITAKRIRIRRTSSVSLASLPVGPNYFAKL